MKEQTYIKIEKINEVISVSIRDGSEIDLIVIATQLIQNAAQHLKTTPQDLLQSIKEGFDKDLIPNTKRIEPSESELN
jgi:hypothetical protein